MGYNRVRAEALAVLIHEKTCHYSHTDQCGWHYEIRSGEHDWDRPSHKPYLKRAEEAIAKLEAFGLDVAAAIEAYNIIS